MANIRSITDFQIVNGGQTTASLTSALLKDDADLSGVLVQLKLSVIKDPEKVGTIVSNISRFANSQNKVNEADLLANDAFHVQRRAPVPHRLGTGPRRGEPRDEVVLRAGARAVQRREGATAVFGREAADVRGRVPLEPVVHQDRPREVREHLGRPAAHGQPRRRRRTSPSSRSSLKKGFVPDIAYFQELVAKAIMFRAAERIVSGQEFGGYRANIVTYTLAWIAHHSGGGVDLRHDLDPSRASTSR